MYERFSDHAREAMQLANAEAERFDHDYIGTEHVLLGLFKVGQGTAAVVLKNANVQLDDIQREVEKLLTPSPTIVKKARRILWWWPARDRKRQLPEAKRVVEYAMEETRNANVNYVGTEHLLLGLLRSKGCVAECVLTNLGLNYDDVRQEIEQLLAEGRRG